MSIDWKDELYRIYGDKIDCTVGRSSAKVQKEADNKADISIYCNVEYNLAVVWDTKHHRNCKATAHTLSLSKNWSQIELPSDGLDYEYKRFHTPDNDEYEKVLLVSFDVLEMIKHDLTEYLKFDMEDQEIDEHIRNKHDDNCYDWALESNRERKSTSVWKRDYRFREMILDNYNTKCAVCNCSEEKILEAAHIVAVKDGGKDTLENGICLCCNHHVMFDRGLFKLNFITHKIYEISDSVKDYINDNLEFSFGNNEMIKNNLEV